MKIGLTKHQPDFFVTTLYDLLSLVRSVTLYEIAEFYLVMSREFCNFAAMIAKRLIGIIVVGAMLLLAGCSGDGYTPELHTLDSIINENPDSALRLIDSLSTEAKSWAKSQRMRHSLLFHLRFSCSRPCQLLRQPRHSQRPSPGSLPPWLCVS